MKARILLLPGDGIGPETVLAARRVLECVEKRFGHDFDFSSALIGGAAIDACGHPLPEDTVRAAHAADAVLLGAVGGPKWDDAPVRPEAALLGMRKELGLYANLRPRKTLPRPQRRLCAETRDRRARHRSRHRPRTDGRDIFRRARLPYGRCGQRSVRHRVLCGARDRARGAHRL